VATTSPRWFVNSLSPITNSIAAALAVPLRSFVRERASTSPGGSAGLEILLAGRAGDSQLHRPASRQGRHATCAIVIRTSAARCAWTRPGRRDSDLHRLRSRIFDSIFIVEGPTHPITTDRFQPLDPSRESPPRPRGGVWRKREPRISVEPRAERPGDESRASEKRSARAREHPGPSRLISWATISRFHVASPKVTSDDCLKKLACVLGEPDAAVDLDAFAGGVPVRVRH
jgi:hypothetical protein